MGKRTGLPGTFNLRVAASRASEPVWWQLLYVSKERIDFG